MQQLSISVDHNGTEKLVKGLTSRRYYEFSDTYVIVEDLKYLTPILFTRKKETKLSLEMFKKLNVVSFNLFGNEYALRPCTIDGYNAIKVIRLDPKPLKIFSENPEQSNHTVELV